MARENNEAMYRSNRQFEFKFSIQTSGNHNRLKQYCKGFLKSL